MKRTFQIDRRSLIVQMVLSFMALALLTAVAGGIPAILLIRSQVDRLAWAQVEQGQRAAAAFYAAQQRATTDLALLTSQRPSIPQLLTQAELDPLAAYLQKLREETELDMLAICSPSQEPAAHSGTAVPADLCRLPDPNGIHIFPDAGAYQVWMLASHVIASDAAGLGQAIVGVALDDTFILRMRAQTGLDHTLLVDGTPLYSSLPGGTAAWLTAGRETDPGAAPEEMVEPATINLSGRPYHTARIPLDGTGLVDEAALDVSAIAATSRQVTGLMVAGIGLLAVAGSTIGALMARRIGRPLTQLTRAAAAIQHGDLDTPLTIDSPVSEVARVTQALDDARVELQRTLGDLRRSQAWTTHLLDTMTEGIVVLNGSGHITFFSPGAERILGCSRQEALAQHCDLLFQLAGGEEEFSRHIPLPGNRGKVPLELEDGRQITVSITSAQLTQPGSGETGLVLVLRDTSEEDLVHRLLGNFLANITHEFRTPLSALAASTELLLDQFPDLSPAEMQELLNALYFGIVSLQTLIDNLLESASLEAGRFHVFPRPADLGQIIAEAAHMMQPLQDKYRQKLVVRLPASIPQVQADEKRTVQVLVNLLGNAIKFSPDGTEIALTVTSQEGWVRVEVADQGPGVPEGQQPALFHRVSHYDPGEPKGKQGVGLGLSVVKAVVEAHGGQVGVSSRAGGGSIFWFTLPLAGARSTP